MQQLHFLQALAVSPLPVAFPAQLYKRQKKFAMVHTRKKLSKGTKYLGIYQPRTQALFNTEKYGLIQVYIQISCRLSKRARVFGEDAIGGSGLFQIRHST